MLLRHVNSSYSCDGTKQLQGRQKEDVVQRERWQDYLQHEDIPGAESLSLLWDRAGRTWQALLDEVKNLPEKDESNPEKTVVVVGHEAVHVAMLGHCLQLTQACLGSFHLDTGSLSVIDLPDGPLGQGVVRCWNYTAHLGRWAVPVTLPTLADEDF
jgi:broad specificity phosphatase PhoE